MPEPSGELLELMEPAGKGRFSRKQYRVRVKGQPGFELHYQGFALPLADISATGASVLSKAAGELDEGFILENCQLNIKKQRFDGIRCQVMHRSIDPEGSLVCGMQWLDLSGEVEQKMTQIVNILRQRMFRAVKGE